MTRAEKRRHHEILSPRFTIWFNVLQKLIIIENPQNIE